MRREIFGGPEDNVLSLDGFCLLSPVLNDPEPNLRFSAILEYFLLFSHSKVGRQVFVE